MANEFKFSSLEFVFFVRQKDATSTQVQEYLQMENTLPGFSGCIQIWYVILNGQCISGEMFVFSLEIICTLE